MSVTRTTLGKALEINENAKIYGTFAEIGAGQEVARFFFQAGRASQTNHCENHVCLRHDLL